MIVEQQITHYIHPTLRPGQESTLNQLRASTSPFIVVGKVIDINSEVW